MITFLPRLDFVHRLWYQILRFCNKLLHSAGALPQEKLTPEFLEMVQNAQSEPDKLAVLEICASLHVYTESLLLDLHKVCHWFVNCLLMMMTMTMTVPEGSQTINSCSRLLVLKSCSTARFVFSLRVSVPFLWLPMYK